MEVVAKERLMVVPVKPIKKHRLFLSNIDLTLVAYYETVAFFKPLKARKLSLLEAFERLRVGLGEILVAYDFVAGRLSPSKEGDRCRFGGSNCMRSSGLPRQPKGTQG
ncbi:hypothetical protein AMTR_s00087p00150710 [Amborella trichopoda]|uniref:Uncharacterized protein n=1 Tax=Amborella trichopoda TaxID=13333 RepID=W1NYA4_AMBTC|nr:hypothetical protein AMTR_s00087p00150710 [Amborella trichopoda]